MRSRSGYDPDRSGLLPILLKGYRGLIMGRLIIGRTACMLYISELPFSKINPELILCLLWNILVTFALVRSFSFVFNTRFHAWAMATLHYSTIIHNFTALWEINSKEMAAITKSGLIWQVLYKNTKSTARSYLFGNFGQILTISK